MEKVKRKIDSTMPYVYTTGMIALLIVTILSVKW